jgi:hypothetical protein
VKRSYAAVMDDSKCGKFMLLSTTPTTEENGTEIIVPVKGHDFSEFVKETTVVTQHWPVKPIIRGGNIAYEQFTALLEGTSWKTVSNSNSSRGYRAIVDGIEYPVPDNLGEYPFSYGTSTLLFFKTGEVSISANRELLELNDKTEKVLRNQIAIVHKELEKKFLDAVANCSTFLEANIRLAEISGNLGLPVPQGLEWNNMKLFGHYTRLEHTTMMYYTRLPSGQGVGKASKHPSSQLSFDKDTVYCLTTRDFDKITESGALSVLRANPDKNKVCMMRCYDHAELEKKNITTLNILKVENFYTPKSRKASLGRLTFYKMNETGDFSRTSLKEYEENNSKKAWCYILKNQGYGSSKQNIAKISEKYDTMSPSMFSNMIGAALPGYSVYGFATDLAQEKVEEATEEMESVESLLNDFIEKNNIELEEVSFAVHLSEASLHAASLLHQHELEEIANDASSFKDGENHEFVKFCKKAVALVKKARFYSNLRGLLHLGRTVGLGKDFTTVERMEGALLVAKYPLLKYFVFIEDRNGYFRRGVSVQKNELIDYINLCDGT